MTNDEDTFSRRNQILDKLNIENSKSVKNLSKELNVSLATIRRDLNFLEKQGSIKRTHGGAILDIAAADQKFSIRENIYKEEKILIAKKAIELIKSGDSIFINDGTTCFYFAKFLSKLNINLTAITTSLKSSLVLSENENIFCYLVGGRVENLTLATSGSYALDMINEFNPDFAFISTDGITAKEGLTYRKESESNIVKHMLNKAKKKVVLFTEDKVGIVENITSTKLDNIDTFITSTKNTDILNSFKKIGIKVLNATKSTNIDKYNNVISFK